MSFDYCEWPEFFSERVSKARKPRRCCECGLTIRAGQMYWSCTGKWDGEIDSFSQHIECRDACFAARGENHECINFGGLREHLEEYGGGYRAWDNDGESKNKRDANERKVRGLFAKGIRAGRLKDDSQVAAYNAQHAGRKP